MTFTLLPRAAREDWINALMTAELLPGLTVEQSCFAACDFIADPGAFEGCDMIAASIALRAAGLAYDEPSLHRAGTLVIFDEKAFIRRFPKLQHVVAKAKAHGPVQVSRLVATQAKLSLIKQSK